MTLTIQGTSEMNGGRMPRKRTQCLQLQVTWYFGAPMKHTWCRHGALSSLDHVDESLRATLRGEPVAELIEEDDAAPVPVDLRELLPAIHLGHPDASEPDALFELAEVHPPIVAIDLVEEPEDLVEVEECSEQWLELLLLHPIVTIALSDGALVSAHEGRLVVQHGMLFHNPLVDLCKRYNVVPIEIKHSPHFPQLVVVLHRRFDLSLELVELA